MQHSFCTGGAQFKHSAGAVGSAQFVRPVKVAFWVEDQPRKWIDSVPFICSEAIQHGLFPGLVQLENYSDAIRPSVAGRTIEVAGPVPDHSTDWISSVAIGVGEAVQHGLLAL